MSTPVVDAVAFVTLVPVCTAIPCFLNDFSSSADTASSSTGHNPREQFENGDRAAEAAEDRRELHADGAAAENDHRLRHFAQCDGLITGDDARAIDRNARNAPGRRAGGDHDLVGCRHALRVAVDHLDPSAPGDRRGAFDPFDLVLPEEELDALGEARDHFVLAGLHLVHVDADRALGDRDTPLLDVLDDLERVRVLEQRFGRNAAPDQARAAERILLLDDRDLQTQLRRTNGRDVAAGSSANHHNIEFARHVFSMGPMRGSRARAQAGQVTGAPEGCQASETRYNTGCSLP